MKANAREEDGGRAYGYAVLAHACTICPCCSWRIAASPSAASTNLVSLLRICGRERAHERSLQIRSFVTPR
eukprot:6214776-Pleurochrysis_carterae.AAC.1